MSLKRFSQSSSSPTIEFCINESWLGNILVAQDSKGICALFLHDDSSILEQALRYRFSHSDLMQKESSALAYGTKVISYLNNPNSLDVPLKNIPLSFSGTSFQTRVWQALCTIPLGSTASYLDVAHQIGCPTGARAIARACATNPIAVLIPCHRVIRNDGKLSGYEWGIDRKQKLLAWELQIAQRQ